MQGQPQVEVHKSKNRIHKRISIAGLAGAILVELTAFALVVMDDV